MAGTYGRAQELYYHRHKAELKVKRAEYRKKYWKEYYAKNKDRLKEKNRKYRESLKARETVAVNAQAV